MPVNDHVKTIAFLERYSQLLEERMDWGKVNEWRYSQFKKLSDELEDATGVPVSYMTLTRILQRQEFKRSPQLATLDALAQFLDFSNWDSFCKSQPLTKEASPPPETVPIAPPRSSNYRGLVVLVTIFLVLTLGLTSLFRSEKVISQEGNQSVRLGILDNTPHIPEMVTLHYQVPDTGYYLWLRPSSHRPTEVISPPENPKNLKYLSPQDTTILLNIDGTTRPGPYEASIVHEGKVLKRVSFNFITDDWITVVHIRSREKRKGKTRIRPLFTSAVRNEEGRLQVSPEIRELLQSTYLEKQYEVNYFLAQDFGVDANQMEFETRLRNTFTDQVLNCKYLRVSLLTTNGMIEIPLVQSGCQSLLRLWVSEIAGSYENRPMAQYETPVLGWENVRIKTENKTVFVYRDDQLVDQIKYEYPLGVLQAIRFKFDGNGLLDYVSLKNKQAEEVLRHDFNLVPELEEPLLQ